MTEVFALRGRVVTSNRIITDGAVVISGDAIVWVGEAPDAKAAGFEMCIRDRSSCGQSKLDALTSSYPTRPMYLREL